MTIYHLDYESRSTVPLDKRGLHNYATDPTTSILCAAFAEGDNKVRVWQPHLEPKMPAELREAIESPFVQIAAWNSPFERSITKFVQKMDKPTSEWIDPSIQARYLSMPGSLEDAGKILRLKEDEGKIKDGKRLLKLFSEPQSLGGVQTLFGVSKPTFRDWSTDPQDWELLLQYCQRDVEAERTIMRKMVRFPVPELERQAWELNERVNETGMPVDLTLIGGARDIADRELEKLRGQLKELTNLENCNSNEQILGWLRGEGYTFGGLGKAFVERAMNGECELTDRARKALEIRKMTSKSSVRKFTAIARNVSTDGRLRNQFVFYGAARTGRFCLAEGTLVKTKNCSGDIIDKPIQDVEIADLVWDGEGWVAHEGVVFSGDKEVIEWDGIVATPEHEVWISAYRKMPLQKAKDKKIKLWTGSLCISSTNSHPPLVVTT